MHLRTRPLTLGSEEFGAAVMWAVSKGLMAMTVAELQGGARGAWRGQERQQGMAAAPVACSDPAGAAEGGGAHSGRTFLARTAATITMRIAETSELSSCNSVVCTGIRVLSFFRPPAAAEAFRIFEMGTNAFSILWSFCRYLHF